MAKFVQYHDHRPSTSEFLPNNSSNSSLFEIIPQLPHSLSRSSANLAGTCEFLQKSDVQDLTNATSDHHPIWHVLVNVCLLSVDHHVLYALHMVRPRLGRRHPIPSQVRLIFLSDIVEQLDSNEVRYRKGTPILCFRNTIRDGGR